VPPELKKKFGLPPMDILAFLHKKMEKATQDLDYSPKDT